MTLPSMHVHISEREVAHTWPDGRRDDARWEDCAWCSAVMWARVTGHPQIPPTHLEAEALRMAAGAVTDGKGDSILVPVGLKRRYGIDVAFIRGPANLMKALMPGTAASIAGSMGVFPDGSRFRRWDPPFHGNHQVAVFRVDDSQRVLWDDPLAPNGTYEGEWMPLADVQRFVSAIDGGHLVGKIVKPVKPVPVEKAVSSPTDLLDAIEGYAARLAGTAHDKAALARNSALLRGRLAALDN